MTEDLLDYWVRMIRPFFPANAWIVTRYAGDDHVIEIDWKLEDEPGRANRRSRKIQITISEGAIEDYLDRDRKERDLFETGLKKLIHERFGHFNAHTPPQGSPSSSADKLLIGRETLTA